MKFSHHTKLPPKRSLKTHINLPGKNLVSLYTTRLIAFYTQNYLKTIEKVHAEMRI